MSKILITGIAGFIGHHMAEHFLANTDFEIVGFDKLTYAANGYSRIRDAGFMDSPRVKLLSGDFSHPLSVGMIKEIGDVDYILHLGAETHVDNSIANAEPFVTSNVIGTMNMLEYARNITNLKRFFYFSTDEVFGPADTTEAYKEWDRHNPTNPYAASKSAGEMICLSYANSYKLPLCITRTMNNFGERQHPEKFIPKVIKSILNNETVIIHSDSTKTRAGSRFYIHCRNVSSAILFLLDKATQRECYHIIGERELDNLEMAKMISKIIGRELNYEMIDFHSSRPGHDMRYSLDGTRLKDMGWQPPKNFEESLAKTINWYLDNKEWLNW